MMGGEWVEIGSSIVGDEVSKIDRVRGNEIRSVIIVTNLGDKVTIFLLESLAEQPFKCECLCLTIYCGLNLPFEVWFLQLCSHFC